MPLTKIPFTLPLAEGEIIQKRTGILTELRKMDKGFCSIPVYSLEATTLKRMLALYDAAFFCGYLSKQYASLDITLSTRLISSAGKFLCAKGAFGRITKAEIRMSGDFLFRLADGPYELNGLSASSPQEAFLIVFEHELCHAIEMALYGKTGHSSRFLALANGLFGHTATRHKLPTRRQEAQEKGLLVGMQVRFCADGEMLCGIITYIGKTATVMVPDPQGDYRDKYGRHFTKYRIPLSLLRIN